MLVRINREKDTLQDIITKLVDVIGSEIVWKTEQLEHDEDLHTPLFDESEDFTSEETLVGEIAGLELAIKLLQSVKFIDTRS